MAPFSINSGSAGHKRESRAAIDNGHIGSLCVAARSADFIRPGW